MDQTTQPFSLQAPEQVAKDYGGNKQKIADAARMGLVDPTAAVLAGMFIDRMRSAQAQEQVPQQTIAQQVLAPSPPPQQMGPPPMGLGATPQGAAMGMAPQQMPMPPQGPPMQAGLGAIQPDVDYADGGLVAFASGGSGYDTFKRAIIGQESGGRYGVANAEGSGALGLGQIMPATAAAIARRLGMPYDPELLAGTSEEAKRYQDILTDAAVKEAWDHGGGDVSNAAKYYFAGPNKKGHGPKTQKYAEDIRKRMGRDGGDIGASQTAEGGGDEPYENEGGSKGLGGMQHQFSDVLAMLTNNDEDPAQRELEAYYRSLEDPAEENRSKERDMWETLAQIGFGMAGSDSPHFLQSFGQAAAAALPGAKAARKDREGKKAEGLKGRAATAQGRRAERKGDIKTAYDVSSTDRQLGQKDAELAQRKELAMAEIEAREDLEKDANAVRIRVAEMGRSLDNSLVAGYYERFKAQYPDKDDGYLRTWAAAAAYRFMEKNQAFSPNAGMAPMPIMQPGQAPGAGWGAPRVIK